MCGLITILNWKAGKWDSEKKAAKAVQRGLDRMDYRGLAGRSGIEVVGRVVLGHVRLPIINLDTSADQPMLVENTFITFTGEIFNYQIQPEAQSDTEALGLEFIENGLQGFHSFDGFWAATLVDHNRVTVVTDYLSQKPLYFHEESLLVASEPRAILSALDRGLPLDPVYFSNVLKWGYDPTGRTPYLGITQLPAGCELSWTKKCGLSQSIYWDWRRIPYESSLRTLLLEATANRMIGDREVGLLLSGGLDSTIVFRLLTQELGADLKVFHTPNGEDRFLAAALDGYPATMLHPPEISLREAVHAHQVPVDLGSMVPQFALAKALKAEGLFVTMTGDGADELFGGYRRAQTYDSQASDTFLELPYYHNPRLDRLMMRETVELRTPFLAPKVIRHALELPWSRRQTKEALKFAFRDLLPTEILSREKHPLKTAEVISGGLAYRHQLIQHWKESYLWSPK
jgi:asparagine synthase (glutamine-hydrolysing)